MFNWKRGLDVHLVLVHLQQSLVLPLFHIQILYILKIGVYDVIDDVYIGISWYIPRYICNCAHLYQP
jgi:hypothetical protein